MDYLCVESISAVVSSHHVSSSCGREPENEVISTTGPHLLLNVVP